MVAAKMPTVLVVEDELLIRLHVADTFRDRGFEVIEAGDAAAALSILKANARVDAVFSDVSLPGGLDGFALARWIRNHRPGVPVVLTSGEVTADHAHAVSREEPFFAKPCDYDHVADFIRQRLQACGA
jgi:DNA-binding NtrC family response regulator